MIERSWYCHGHQQQHSTVIIYRQKVNETSTSRLSYHEAGVLTRTLEGELTTRRTPPRLRLTLYTRHTHTHTHTHTMLALSTTSVTCYQSTVPLSLCAWEGNRRSGIAMAMCYRLQWSNFGIMTSKGYGHSVCGLHGPKEACWMHTGATWRIPMNRPCAALMPSFCQITLTNCYYYHSNSAIYCST